MKCAVVMKNTIKFKNRFFTNIKFIKEILLHSGFNFYAIFRFKLMSIATENRTYKSTNLLENETFCQSFFENIEKNMQQNQHKKVRINNFMNIFT